MRDTGSEEDDQSESEWGVAQADAPEHAAVSGRVKWFDAVRGYGFVVPDDGGSDILLHYNLLVPHGRKTLPEGAMVSVEVCEGQRGRAARRIVLLDLNAAAPPVPNAPCARNADRIDPTDYLDSAGDFAAVQVRWFNRSKGYGFLLGEDGVTETFIHMETVRRAGFETLEPGQHVRARISQGPRGALAVVIEAAGPGNA